MADEVDAWAVGFKFDSIFAVVSRYSKLMPLDFAARAPYLSVVLIVAVGVYTGWLGWSGLPA